MKGDDYEHILEYEGNDQLQEGLMPSEMSSILVVVGGGEFKKYFSYARLCPCFLESMDHLS